jgi:hypothetical protein
MDGTPPRGQTHAGGDPATRPRGGFLFDYRLLDLSGREVGLLRRRQALRANEVVVLPGALGEEQWRIVAVLGLCATVVAAPR